MIVCALLLTATTASAQEALVDVENQVTAQNAEANRKMNFLRKTAQKMGDAWGAIVDSIKTQTLSGSIKYDVKFGDGKVGIKNKIEVEPAYIDDYFRRMDEYELPIAIEPGFDLTGDIRGFIRLEKRSRISLWRLYPSFKEAMCPLKEENRRGRPCVVDFTLDYIPVTADHILKKLKPGEMVRLQIPINLLTGLRYQYPIDNMLALEASKSEVYSGWFSVYVFRGDNNLVRLRLVGGNDNHEQFELTLGFRRDYFSSVLRKIVRATGGLEIVDYQNNDEGHSNIFLADYTLNFNDDQVKEAYDQLFGRAVTFSESNLYRMLMKLAYPFSKTEDLRNVLVSNLTAIEDIYKADLNSKNPRIVRNFVGSNESFTEYDRKFTLNLPLFFKTQWRTGRAETRLTRRIFVDEDGELSEVRDNFLFPSWSSARKGRSYLFDYKEELFRSANAIFKADENFKPVGFSSIGFYYDARDGKYQPGEHEDFIQHVQRVLPAHIFRGVMDELDQKGFRYLKERVRNVRASMHYFINEQGLRRAERRFHALSRQDAQTEILRLLADHVRPLRLSTPGTYQEHGRTEQRCKAAGINFGKNHQSAYVDPVRKFCKALDTIATELALIIDFEAPAMERKLALDRLTDNAFFRKLGPGFFFSLLSDYDFEQVARFELRFFVPGQTEPITVFRGHAPERELYEEILDQQRMLIEEVPDLRLDGDRDSLTTRDVKSA